MNNSRKQKEYSTTLYSEDIRHAINCLDYIPVSIVANVFRLNPKQMASVSKKSTNHFYSVNCDSSKAKRGVAKRGRAKIMCNRSVEAAANLHYIGYTIKEIAAMFGDVDDTTVNKALRKYHGYTSDCKAFNKPVNVK